MIDSQTMSYVETQRLWVEQRRSELEPLAPLIVGQANNEDIKDAFMLHIPVNWPDGSPLMSIRMGESDITYSHLEEK